MLAMARTLLGEPTVLLVEQNAAQALRRADRAYVLESGRIVREGAGRALLDDAAVRAAYLGSAALEGHNGGSNGG